MHIQASEIQVLLLFRLFGTADVKEQDITGHDQVKSEDEGGVNCDQSSIDENWVN